MKYLRYIFLLCLFGFLFSCKKHVSNPSYANLSGKIKSLNVVNVNDTVPTPYVFYSFYYDSITGNVNKILKNSVNFVIVTYGNNSEITIRNLETNDTLIIHVQGNQITSINKKGAVGEEPYYRFHFTGNYIDSIISPDAYPNAYNVMSYGFIFDGNNYTRSIVAYDVAVFIPGHYTDTGMYTYTAMLNTPQIPTQIIHTNVSTIWLSYQIIDPLYILGLSGYTVYPPNKNLISSINTTPFTYTTDAQNRVIQMKIGPPSYSPLTYLLYTFTYY
ncbi:MAG: hypothetical protein JWN78_1351 [Bacteroidota bacterium]|nr:hypothetical protein [Bacteroidota bacterium]